MDINNLLSNKGKTFFETQDKTKCNYMVVRVNPTKTLRGVERHVKNNSLQTYFPNRNDHVSIEEIASWSGANICHGIEKGYIMDAIEDNDYIIISASLNLVPIVAATLTGVGALFLTGCLKPNEGYAAIEWSIIFLIYGMLGVGMAMFSTGTATFLVDEFAALTQSLFSDSLRPYIMLIGLYLCTTVLTEFLSNNATIVLMAPVAMGIAETLGVDPRPFIITAAIASSASFSTPIGYQTNTFIFGVGGHRFSDFYKIGLPLNIIFFIVSMALNPRIWSF